MTQATPSLSFSDAINASASKIFQFQGRSRRSEFWWTQLLVFIISFILTPIVGCLLDLLTIPLTFRRLHDTGRSGWWWGIGALLKLSFIMPFTYDFIMAVTSIKNFIGNEAQTLVTILLKYGIFMLIISVYQIILLILCCLDSEQFENQYGPSPKYIDDTNLNQEQL